MDSLPLTRQQLMPCLSIIFWGNEILVSPSSASFQPITKIPVSSFSFDFNQFKIRLRTVLLKEIPFHFPLLMYIATQIFLNIRFTSVIKFNPIFGTGVFNIQNFRRQHAVEPSVSAMLAFSAELGNKTSPSPFPLLPASIQKILRAAWKAMVVKN